MMNDNANNNKLVPAICTQCGGQNEVNPSLDKVVCNYCGTTFYVDKAIQTYNAQNTKFIHVESWNIEKPGTVESILNFVEKQEDKKQQKVYKEKRKLEEEKKKQEEQREKIINQLFNKQYRKRNLGILGAFFVFILFFSFRGGSSEEQDNIVRINIPASSSDCEGENYQDVVAKFENAGFTNVRTEVIEDLVFGWLTKDGEIEEVSVDGNTTFSTNSRYPPDIEIVVSFHTFMADEEEETAELSTPDPSVFVEPTEEVEPTVEVEPIIEVELTEEVEPTVEAELTEKAQSTEETLSSEEEEIITVDNNEEFAAVLNAKDPGDQIIKDFAQKYAGRTIEFDGNIAHMIYYGDDTKKYDFLIFAWDYSEISVSGPNFQFRNCSFFDLNLIGTNEPDAVGMGDNLHFVAKLIGYNETQELFFLDPISTEGR